MKIVRYNPRVDYLTLAEMAQEIGLRSTAALRRLCEIGALPGAEKKGKTWFIPLKTVDWYKRERLGKRGRPPKGRNDA